MFLAIVDLSLKEEKISEFKNWIGKTNKTLSKFDVWNLNQRGPLVHTGDHNGTHVFAYELKGGPCVYQYPILIFNAVL